MTATPPHLPASTAITLLTGPVRPLPGTDVPSGICKTPVDRPVLLGPTGFEGDEQGDPRVHGGPQKAVHHYPADHYPLWQAELGPLPPLQQPGAFGENLSTHGLTEENVAIGDSFALGKAVIQVSQGRQPCWKLNLRFGVADMARQVQDTGRTGWYYRVLQPGLVAPDDRMQLLSRPAPQWTLHRLWHALYVDRMNLPELQAIADLDLLAEGWRKYAVRRLASRQVEDWRTRLEGKT